MKHIVSFSTGLSSALTAERVFQKHDASDVWIVFMDTRVEDADNYRFRDEIYVRWRDVYGAENFVELCEGRTPLEVAEDEHIIPNQKIAPCTYRLKIEPFTRWLGTLHGEATIHIGYDYSEVHRCGATRRNYEELGFEVDFPLLWRPLELRSYPEVCRQEWGLEPPRMYRQGYSHANCGGACVKQGQGDWARTLEHKPGLYAKYEQWERDMRRDERFEDYAFLRDQSGGTVTPKTLEEFREERRANGSQLKLLDFNGGCVRCGVGDFGETEHGTARTDLAAFAALLLCMALVGAAIWAASGWGV